MAKNPEAQFRAAVHRYMPKSIHVEGMANAYRGGTPDNWYDGCTASLWVEYKFCPSWPRLLTLNKLRSKPALTRLQQRWLERADKNGRNVAVIVGSKGGGIILPHQSWACSLTRTDIDAQLRTKRFIAEWIEAIVCKGLTL